MLWWTHKKTHIRLIRRFRKGKLFQVSFLFRGRFKGREEICFKGKIARCVGEEVVRCNRGLCQCSRMMPTGVTMSSFANKSFVC